MLLKDDAMPRSFLIKKNNYSHCPLKKRPVPIYKEDPTDDEKEDIVDDNSEPENLSTKPEDLSLSAAQKTLTPPPGVVLLSNIKAEISVPQRHNLTSPAHHHPPQLIKSSGGPLEPLNLNTQAESHHYFSSPNVWHRPVGSPHYPTPYLTFNYPYPPPAELYGHPQYPPSLYPVSPVRSHIEQQLSPYAPREPTSSPPLALSGVRTPVPVVASLPSRPPQGAEMYIPYHPGLSPTSSVSPHSVFHSPPATPEDLSSPGSVSSGSSTSSACGGSSQKKRKDGSAPRYQCPDCSKSYSTYSGLSKHQQFHCAAGAGSQAVKSFSCKYCEKIYVSLGALKMHIRTHTLPCKCKLCGKAFSRPWLLQGHIRTHTGEKPFSCPHCHRAFADRSNLRAHLQTHSDVKKYSCTSCSKTFSRMSLLSKHLDGGCPGATQLLPPIIHRDLVDDVHVY